GGQNPNWQISSQKLKNLLENSDATSNGLEIIAVLPNLKLPFTVHQTIPIQQFDVNKITIHKKKTYIIVCQLGFNSYRATAKLKAKYPNVEVLSLAGGISSYNDTRL
ncbi:MAG: rhodanese-like domain-containing protein, partial [Polaribacter sp.]